MTTRKLNRRHPAVQVASRALKEVRGSRLTQEELSLAANLSPHVAARIERGAMVPRADTLWEIARSQGITLSELLSLGEKEGK
jgi:transcriptional regulator with XRE-family HTH domain